MTGSSPLVCSGFVETEIYTRSKTEVMGRLGLTNEEIDNRLEGLVWALYRESSSVAERVPGRNLWVAVTEYPRLRVYLRPRTDGVADECELLWIEEG